MKRFALLHSWPDLKNAEYEVIARILLAAKNISVGVTVIDENGLVLWSTDEDGQPPGSPLDPKLVDFLISLHFTTPKPVDVFSYYTNWQPLDFYLQFGYEPSVRKILTYDDALSCGSDLADGHVRNLFRGAGRHLMLPLPHLYHMVAEPYLPPSICETSRLFYTGINWERLGSRKGRHHDLLMRLQPLGMLDIYGPETTHGCRTWEGFTSYRGELPFDGESVQKAANRAGIVLALSSAAHRSTGILSNRVFEGLGGGAAVISDSHPLIDKYFKDVIYEVDPSQGEEALTEQIVETLERIRREPEEANKRVRRGQELLKQKFSLEKSLQTIFRDTPERKKHYLETLSAAEVAVILTHRSDDIDQVVAQVHDLARQLAVNVRVHLICDASFADKHRDHLRSLARGAICEFSIHPVSLLGRDRRPTGPVISEVLSQSPASYVAFIGQGDRIFSDHLGSIIAAMQGTDAAIGHSGMVIEINTDTPSRSTDLQPLTMEAAMVPQGQSARFVFSVDLLDGDLLGLCTMLDGEEPYLFVIAGCTKAPIAESWRATYLHKPHQISGDYSPVMPVAQQHSIIRDLFRSDPVWLNDIAVPLRDRVSVVLSEQIKPWESQLREQLDQLNTKLGAIERNLYVVKEREDKKIASLERRLRVVKGAAEEHPLRRTIRGLYYRLRAIYRRLMAY